MNCKLTEKVSLFIDRALTLEEAEQMKSHLAACPECRQVEHEFRSIGRQINSYAIDADPFAERHVLWRILTSQKAPLWRRRIALPVPVVAIALASAIAMAVWLVFLAQARAPALNEPGRRASAETDDGRLTESGISLSRFDRGQRAVIYKIRQAEK